jgi:zinc/manganese transport system ATP-binding protein
MTGECLSSLYGTEVDVFRVRGRVIVVGAADSTGAELGTGDHLHERHGEARSGQWSTPAR